MVHEPTSARVAWLVARPGRLSPSDGCTMVAIPVTMGPDGPVLDGLADSLRAAAPEFIWIDVEPDDVPAMIRIAGETGVPIVLASPSAASILDVQELSAAAAVASAPILVGHRLPFCAGLLRATALRSHPSFQELQGFSLEVRISMSHLRMPHDSDVAHDDLVAEVANALSALQHLGISVKGMRLANPIDTDYWNQMVLVLDGPQSGRLVIKPSGAQAGDTGILTLTGPQWQMKWQTSDAGEQLEIVLDGKRRVETFATLPFPGGMLAYFSNFIERGLPLYEGIDTLANVLDTALERVDEYLHQNTVTVRQIGTRRQAQEEKSSGSFWSRFKLVQQGFESGFEADRESMLPFLVPLDTPFRLLLTRLPMATADEGNMLAPPYALARLSAMAAQIGAETTALDLAPCFRPPSRTDPSLVDVPGLKARIASSAGTQPFELAGFSIEDPRMWPVVDALSRFVKDSGIAPTVVIGGSGASKIERDLFRASKAVDFVVFGEGELALLRLLQCLRGQASIDTVPGLWLPSWPLDRSSNPDVIADLDELPTPDFSGLDLMQYPVASDALRRPFLPFLFFLGCTFHCAFCTNRSGQKPRVRSPKRVVEDLRQMRDRHGVRDFLFLNNMINTAPGPMRAWLDAMERADLGIRWCDCARASGITKEDIERMARVGCVELTWGVDTCSRRMARYVQKGCNLDRVRETLQVSHEAGIRNVVNLIVGMPTETEEEFDEECRYVESILPFVDGFNNQGFNYNQGSPMYEMPLKFGLRRRGNTYDEIGGLRWREHLRIREQRKQRMAQVIGRK